MSKGFPGTFESTNLSRDSLSREIGRKTDFIFGPPVSDSP